MNLTSLLFQAILEPVGLSVITSDPAAFKRKFYAERAKAREAGNYAFDCLSLIVPAEPNKLWIINGQVAEK